MVVRYIDRTPDDRLLASRRADDFGHFYERHEAVVLAYLLKMTRDPEVAADLTAETFATALVQARRYDVRRGPAVAWLLGIARHAVLKFWERQEVERRARQRLLMLEVKHDVDALERVDALLDESDPDNPLFNALSELPPAQRDAIRSHILGDVTYEELEERLGVPAATLRQRVSRGLARLRLTLLEVAG